MSTDLSLSHSMSILRRKFLRAERVEGEFVDADRQLEYVTRFVWVCVVLGQEIQGYPPSSQQLKQKKINTYI